MPQQPDPFELAMQQAEAQVNQHPTAPPSLGQKFIDYGGMETVGGLLGGAAGSVGGGIGAVPGAMAGAALARYLRGRVGGESVPQAVAYGVGQGALEGVFPAAGGLLSKVGPRMVRAALPIAEQTAKEVGHGVASRGAKMIAQEATNAPGMRLSSTFRNVGQELSKQEDKVAQAVQAAERTGTTIPTQPIIAHGEALLGPGGRISERIGSPASQSGARRTLGNFKSLAETQRPATDEEIAAAIRRGEDHAGIGTITEPTNFRPTRARNILKNTEFYSGSPDVPGADMMGKALRTQLSEQFKQAIPAARQAFERQHALIPVQETLDRALFRSGAEPVRGTAEALISGGNPRLFGLVRVPKSATFAAGKVAARTGQGLQSLPARLLPSMMRLAASHGQ